MKLIISVLVFMLIHTNVLCQDETTSITVVRLKNGSAFIEVNNDTYNFSKGKYWITANTSINLQNALAKAKKWANLNLTEMAEFKKEVIRIRTMDKDIYISYKEYFEPFSSECKLIFNGLSNGTFFCTLEFESIASTITYTFSTIDSLDKMIKMLQGKSISKIDEVFN